MDFCELSHVLIEVQNLEERLFRENRSRKVAGEYADLDERAGRMSLRALESSVQAEVLVGRIRLLNW